MRKLGILFMTFGAVLISAALLLLLYNRNEDNLAGQAVMATLPDVQNAISEHSNSASVEGSAPTDEHIDPFDYAAVEEAGQMTVTTVGDYDYIGYLTIPVLELELPVMSDWTYENLKLTPCRHMGSSKTDDLVIAGHNYKQHFGKIPNLQYGDLVIFTDMEGTVNTYTVGAIETLEANAIEWVEESDWALILYTYTYSGKDRIAVCCERITADR